MTPLGVIPTRSLTVFLLLYDENVHDCERSEEGRLTENSVASMINLVLG